MFVSLPLFVFDICYSDYVFNHHIAFTVERLINIIIIHYFILYISVVIIVLKLKAIHAVSQVRGFQNVELFAMFMDNSSADYKSFKQMFFDLAIITMSLSAKGGK